MVSSGYLLQTTIDEIWRKFLDHRVGSPASESA